MLLLAVYMRTAYDDVSFDMKTDKKNFIWRKEKFYVYFSRKIMKYKF